MVTSSLTRAARTGAIAFGVALGATGAARPPVAAAQVVVVVNQANPIDNVSLTELRDLYLGATTRFRHGERVVLLEQPRARPRFYEIVLRMSEARVRRHWIGLVFSGEGVLPPRELRDAEEITRYVSAHPGAIGVVTELPTSHGLKVLSVGGLLPADPRYPLR